MSFTVTVPAGTCARLRERVAAEGVAHPLRYGAGASSGTYRERRAARAAALAERERRRDRGEVLDTLTALVAHHVRLVLQQRRWDRDWPDPPAGWTSVPGRPRGGHLHASPDRLTVELPASLARRLHGAVYAANREVLNAGGDPVVSVAGLIREAVAAAAPHDQEGGDRC